MRVSFLFKLGVFCLLALLFLVPATANVTSVEAAKLLPARIGTFRAQKAALPYALRAFEHGRSEPKDFGIVSADNRVYAAANGEALAVDVIKTDSDAGAYALLSKLRASGNFSAIDGIGTEAIDINEHNVVAFFKGPIYVFIYSMSGKASHETLVTFARSFAGTLDAGANEIPVLVKHLPEWETMQQRALYYVSLPALQMFTPNQPVLEAVSFAGGTEAVTARYPSGQLVIIEFATPQLAADNDARINEKINQLRGAGQPTPSAYKRTGNYSVFVFDAPDDGAAKSLIGQVKYEKDVRWLGDNPYAAERANRRWLNMSVGVIVNTLKVSGLAIVLCLGVGAAFGGAIFMRRRTQAANQTRFSDAGGMVRLNLDDLAAESNPVRLLKRGGE